VLAEEERGSYIVDEFGTVVAVPVIDVPMIDPTPVVDPVPETQYSVE
jgi:hypothetical protein